jgi:thiol-disulfide isomerase/thioredoxin
MIPTLLFLALSFKVVGIDCAACGPPVVKALSAVPGVKDVKVDTNTGMATVDVPPNFDKAKLHAALVNAGFEMEQDFAPLPAEVVKTLDIESFNGRTRINLPTLAVPGKITLVDFYADWCGPCKVLETRLERYMQAHPNVALRRLDIAHWDNVAAHQASDLGATALPYVRVYDAKGKFVAAVTGGMWDEMLGAIEKAGK